MKILITTGGTQVPIDRIRHIGNSAHGRTGAEIAKAAVSRGWEVTYVHAKQSLLPWTKDLELNPTTSPEVGAERVRTQLKFWNEHPIATFSFRTFDEYQKVVVATINNYQPDVVILAAAVSDYQTQGYNGKLGSAENNLRISLTPTPKVITEIRHRFPRVRIVGFKNLVDETPAELIEAAYRSVLKNKLSACIANLTPDPYDSSTWQTYLVTQNVACAKLSAMNSRNGF